ncbi:hypothetical protein V7122_17040 [Bacillus sp. JJ1532]|uniref:hypothetical protein n=1 Tax=unclassified Bacillus (in: firmicutes) TaxID=185979 RepID=UPI002FFDFC18
MTKIELELEQSVTEEKGDFPSIDHEEMGKRGNNDLLAGLPFSEDFILELSKSNPKLLES